jgi:hypothetical protein
MQIDGLLELFTALGQVARDTRKVLARALGDAERRLSADEEDRLDAAGEHLGRVREGCIVTMRAESVRSNSELWDLVQHVLVDWSWLRQLRLAWDEGEQALEVPVAQVLSFAHASVALGCLPRLPPDHVTYPSPTRSYADIPVPHSPGEWLERIEELEVVISALGARPAAAMPVERLRRTYGYFEASAWLVDQHQRRWRR